MSESTHQYASKSITLVVEGLTRDGANTWIASMSAPELGVTWPTVYLDGATEEDAYTSAQARFSEWLRTRPSMS